MERLIIDGYNVIHACRRYQRLATQDLDAARGQLVEDVAAYVVGGPWTMIVFDGGGNAASDGVPHHIAGVAVMFSPAGKSADSVIEGLAQRGRERGDRVMVVTSDAAMQATVFAGEVSRMSSAEFVGRLGDASGDWLEHAPIGSMHGRLEDRVGDDVRATLYRWARGITPER